MIMTQQCLGCDEATACAHLAKRLSVNELSRTFTEGLLEVDEAYQVLDKHDYSELWDEQKDAVEKAQTHETFRADWAETRRRHPGEHGGQLHQASRNPRRIQPLVALRVGVQGRTLGAQNFVIFRIVSSMLDFAKFVYFLEASG